MNVRNLLVALLVILTQLHTSVAQTPTPPDARIGPPQFEHGTKLMYAAGFTPTLFADGSTDIPDGSILKWMTVYYACSGSLITRTSTLGVPFTLTLRLVEYPYEGEQIESPSNPNDPNDSVNYSFWITGTVIYTESVSLFVTDRRIRRFTSREMTTTLDFYKYSYFMDFGSSSTVTDTPHACYRTRTRIAYLPPIVGINAFLPNVNRP